MVEFRNVANFDAVWLPRWRRAGVRAYMAKKSKKKVCSDYLFENSCNLQSAKANQDFVLLTRDNYKDVATTVSFALKQIVPNV